MLSDITIGQYIPTGSVLHRMDARVKILLLLHQHEICVGGLAKQLNVSGSAVSHQLRLLKSNRLVKMRREGREIIYSLADGHIHTIIEKGLEHILE